MDERVSFIYPALTGSKTPTSRFKGSEEDRWGIIASKSPIGRAFHQWEMKKLSTDGSFTL
ncbi:hypothetical protein CON64_00655 [Bacillus pseudomycoides]|nr:hypothetical protein CON64_00655 [Bacillus pseudomycoides]